MVKIVWVNGREEEREVERVVKSFWARVGASRVCWLKRRMRAGCLLVCCRVDRVFAGSW